MKGPTDPDYEAFFRRYAEAYDRSLGDSVDTAAIRGFFAETSLALGNGGTVHPVKNDDGMDAALRQMYAFAKSIGTRHMGVDRVEVGPLAEGYDRARVFYRAEYEKKDGSRLTLPFDVVYLLQHRGDGPRIFAFVAGDEMDLYRRHGLVDEEGKPT